jgi:hypothetical protein
MMRRPTLTHLALAAVLVGYAALAYGVRDSLLAGETDTWVHLALIRHTIERGWFPGDPFYAGLPTPPYYSFAHIVYAAISSLSGWAPHEIMRAAGPVVATLTILAVFAWLRALSGDARVAVVGAATELLIQIPGSSWAGLPYPRELALAPAALALWWYLRGRVHGERSALAAAGIAVAVGIGIHLFVGVVTVLAVTCLELALRQHQARWRDAAFTAAVAAVFASPWVVNFVYARSLRPARMAAELALPLDTWRFAIGSVAIRLFDPTVIRWALPAPALWLIVALGVATCVGRYAAGRATLTERFALISVALALALTVTPLYGLLIPLAGVWTPRVLRLLPLSLLMGLGVAATVDWIASRRPRTRVGAAVAASVAAGAIGVATYHRLAHIYNTHLMYAPLGRHIDWQPLIDVAGGRAGTCTVLSDPWTSYPVPYYLGCSIVTMPPWHGSAYADHAARDRAARRVYNPRTSLDEVLDTLDEFHVDTLILALPQPYPAVGDAARLLRRLRRHAAFEDTGCCGDLVVLHYHRERINRAP